MFAKIFETKEHGQILVKQDSGEKGPEVRIYFQPSTLGVCSFALSFNDTDDGWDKADACFAMLDEDACKKQVKATIDSLGLNSM